MAFLVSVTEDRRLDVPGDRFGVTTATFWIVAASNSQGARGSASPLDSYARAHIRSPGAFPQ
jgi:hypothetical protein